MDMMYGSDMAGNDMNTIDMMDMGDTHVLPDTTMPDITMDGFAGNEDFGGHDFMTGGDIPEGNSSEMMMYQDPLSHAQEFQPDPFLMSEEGVNGDSVSDTADTLAVSYIPNVHGGIMPAFSNVDSLPGVENGMLTDSSQLQQIIDMGEIAGAQHIDSDDIVRSEEMKKAFLHKYGYTEVPVGYEVHHIVPLSEGGADDPQNMILLSDMDHKAVTEAQHLYYGW